jgi:UDP-glucose 4-epimerase
MQKKHVIVTGGAGYIGSHTIIELLEKTDYRVISIDNFSNSSEEAYHRIEKITHKKHFDKIKVDLSNFEKLSTALYHFDDIDIAGVIHFAAFKSVGDSMEDPLKYYDNNLGALVNVLKLCEHKNIKHFIFSSSCSVYGDTKALPVTEETPLQKAASPYGHTKQMGEEILKEYCGIKKDFKCIALRYFNPVGAHMSGMNGELPIHKPTNLVPVITQTAMGKNSLAVHGSDYDTRDGTCIRDYVHVTDIADAHVKALEFIAKENTKTPYSVYNLGTGQGVSVLEAINAFEKVSGKKLNYKMGPRRPGDVVEIYSNCEKAQKDFGWTPKYNIDDMMLSAWKWEQEL